MSDAHITQIGLSQIILSDLANEAFFEQAAAAGYEVVELCLRQEGQLTLETSEAEQQKIVLRAHDRGLSIASLVHGQCTGNLLDAGEPQRRSIVQTCAGLEVAAAMGIGCTLHTLGHLHAELYYDDAYQNTVQSLQEIAVTAERVGVDLAIEFVWNGFLFSPLEMKRLLDDVQSPRIGFYFDPGNMAVFQYPQHWARILGPHIQMVHLKDWKGGALNGSWPPLLEGDVDYALINLHLRDAGYHGPMISEVSPDVAPLEKTAQAMRKIIAM